MSTVNKLASKLIKQTKKPTGRFGRFLVRMMNISHSSLTNWGLTHVSIEKHDRILDVGCGSGETIRKLAAIAAAGNVYGIDHSEASVSVARGTNKQLISEGRAEIQYGSVSSLPFPDQMFDLVTAVETHYFWPDLAADVREILRVLKPGGRLMILAEAYKGGKHAWYASRFIESARKEVQMSFPGVDELRDLFLTAGYSEVQIFEEHDKGWICGVGKRPEGEDPYERDVPESPEVDSDADRNRVDGEPLDRSARGAITREDSPGKPHGAQAWHDEGEKKVAEPEAYQLKAFIHRSWPFVPTA